MIENQEDGIYCPICARYVFASNAAKVLNGDHDSYIFVHDNIDHDDTDIEALSNNIN
jgi:hypothetical protein